MGDKYFSLVLHSHIPFVVGHGTWPHGMDWLYEAAAECYLPLLDVLERLVSEGISPRVTIGLTPVLAEQLRLGSFAEGFRAYLRMKEDVAAQDVSRFQKNGDATLLRLARFWRNWYERVDAHSFRDGHPDIVERFRALQDQGHIEILTSAATHAYFPLLSRDESITAHIKQGRLSYQRLFGREAEGFWLPECGYRPGYAWTAPFGSERAVERKGIDVLLGEQGLSHFFVPAHLLRGGTGRGVYEERFPALRLLWDKAYDPSEGRNAAAVDRSPYSLYHAHPSGVVIMARDEISGGQVWSRHLGYPGDPAYLEFHKKHFPGGLRYWRITGGEADLADKAPYAPGEAQASLESQAAHFVRLLEETLSPGGREIVVALFDTELFGHWWFEGPEWLYLVRKKLKDSSVRPLRSRDCLEKLAPRETIALREGSWGEGGFHSVWLNKNTAWIWKKIYEAERRVYGLETSLSARRPRLARQLMREKFLLESSDWPFLISTLTAKDYAETRAAEHFDRLMMLGSWLERPGELSPSEDLLLMEWEAEDGLFPEVVGPRGETLP